jgi:hypothetical protein
MNDKEVRELTRKISKVFDKWKDILGLGGHRFSLSFERSYCVNDSNVIAKVSPSWQYKNHHITFFLPKINDLDTERELEEAVVHELVHILVHPISGDATVFSSQQEKTNFDEMVEFTTTSVSFALLWAYDAGEESAKKKLKKEKKDENRNDGAGETGAASGSSDRVKGS